MADIKIKEGVIPPDRQYLVFMEGGEGSGNAGHVGRKGQRGGSAPKGSAPVLPDRNPELAHLSDDELKSEMESLFHSAYGNEEMIGNEFTSDTGLGRKGRDVFGVSVKDRAMGDTASYGLSFFNPNRGEAYYPVSTLEDLDKLETSFHEAIQKVRNLHLQKDSKRKALLERMATLGQELKARGF